MCVSRGTWARSVTGDSFCGAAHAFRGFSF